VTILEGKKGQPRLKPPFPANVGLYGAPTTINNVETIANIPIIINQGWETYSKIGTPKHPGPILVGVSGHVNNPGIFEMPTGEPLLEIIYKWAGGVLENKGIKAVIPGGSSTMILRGDQLEGVRMDADSLKNAGSSVGTAGIIVMNSDTDLIQVITRIAQFYYHESCGQCTPCRVGCQQLRKGIEAVKRGDKPITYLEQLMKLSETMKITAKCGLGQSVANSFSSIVSNFKEEMIY
jgi:NADH-quinone oxidoreductase subunit F